MERTELLRSGAASNKLGPAQQERGIENVVRETRAVLIRQNREDQLELRLRLGVTPEQHLRIIEVTQHGDNRVHGRELEDGAWIDGVPD